MILAKDLTIPNRFCCYGEVSFVCEINSGRWHLIQNHVRLQAEFLDFVANEGEYYI